MLNHERPLSESQESRSWWQHFIRKQPIRPPPASVFSQALSHRPHVKAESFSFKAA